MKIGFVFTNYNNSKFTKEAILSISLNKISGEAIIVVVDNNSENKEVELLKDIKSEFPDINLILNDQNYGYFTGLNIGLNFLKKKNLDYIIIGNNDLIFPSDFIKSVYERKELFEKYPVISPDLITLDGIHQNPHVINKISTVREFIYDIYYSSYRLALLINLIAKRTRKLTDRKDEEQYSMGQIIHQGYGACYILGPLFFKSFDQLWAPTFLMGEEFFLSKQLEGKKMKLYYEPGIQVKHQEHASMSKIPKKKIWEYSRQAHKIYRNYVSAWK